MKKYLKADPWSIIEEGFDPKLNRISESVFSIGNGRMGQRANFEEGYSGDTLSGSYVAGVYYPDKTRVGWWKNGYPEYFAKVLNSGNWIGIGIVIDGTELDLASCPVTDFTRVLNMREGYLERSFKAELPGGKTVKVLSVRFCSLVDDQIGAIRYSITPLNFSGSATISPYVDFDVINEDSNYDEKFWEEVEKEVVSGTGWITARTKKLDFQVCTGMQYTISQATTTLDLDAAFDQRDKYIANRVEIDLKENEETVIFKYGANVSSENHPKASLSKVCKDQLAKAARKGFDTLRKEQASAWSLKWEESDIEIEGDVEAQQGIRFNIFQLNQTYTGQDVRLNIGPKGFTGEKYGGSTYWDTEAYCLPFYLGTADEHVAKNLLIYRYKHLEKAIENGAKLGFKNGAALYPMVTMNGEECHNEWEITFEEIHRNGAIAFAIYDYIRYTGDEAYLIDYGLEVLIGISRFWAQRVSYSTAKKKYVMLGVTGPNEYENNVNNNWYTSTIAKWTLDYTSEALSFVQQYGPDKLVELTDRLNFDESSEVSQWKKISEDMFLPEDKSLGIFLQQEGYLDKELLTVDDIPEDESPLNQNWSWDRILRSCFIKQADVLQGIYLLEEKFSSDEIKSNFDFYEPKTVHESSLSPCVHSILAAKIGYHDKAYEFYLRTARLDLDDYNNDTEDGCHITSMAGTWMSFVKGFGGMRIRDGKLHFNPFIPAQWKSYAFRVRFRGYILDVKVSPAEIEIINHSDQSLILYLKGQELHIGPRNSGSLAQAD